MHAMPKRPYKYRELIKRLKNYGIVEMTRKRGKGSEIILLKPEPPGSTQGLQYPIKNHGGSTEIHIPVINALLRRFKIDPADFWE
jgi:hypothetical protein